MWVHHEIGAQSLVRERHVLKVQLDWVDKDHVTMYFDAVVQALRDVVMTTIGLAGGNGTADSEQTELYN